MKTVLHIFMCCIVVCAGILNSRPGTSGYGDIPKSLPQLQYEQSQQPHYNHNQQHQYQTQGQYYGQDQSIQQYYQGQRLGNLYQSPQIQLASYYQYLQHLKYLQYYQNQQQQYQRQGQGQSQRLFQNPHLLSTYGHQYISPAQQAVPYTNSQIPGQQFVPPGYGGYGGHGENVLDIVNPKLLWTLVG